MPEIEISNLDRRFGPLRLKDKYRENSFLQSIIVSLRTKEALAVKKMKGIKLGKPKGTLQRSKFDKDKERILELLKLVISVRKIAKIFGYNNHISLNTYVNKRNLIKNHS